MKDSVSLSWSNDVATELSVGNRWSPLRKIEKAKHWREKSLYRDRGREKQTGRKTERENRESMTV